MRGPIVILGNVVVDVLIRSVEEPLNWNATTLVDAIEQHPGGNGANTATAIAKLGVPVLLRALVGADFGGDWLRGRLQSAGILTSEVHTVAAPTSSAVSMIHPSGERALYYHMGASAGRFPDALPAGSHLHIAAPFRMEDLRTRGADFLLQARSAGLSTSIDTQWDSEGEWMDVLAASFPHCDTLFVNEREGQMLTGAEEPGTIARELGGLGPSVVVVKLGAAGCLVWDRGSETYVAGYSVAAIDTTGAGDAFVGGFLAAQWRGTSIKEAARWGNAVGALSTIRIGASAGLRSLQDTRDFMSRQFSAG